MLSINIWEILWTIVNFLILYFLLKRFLYKPIMKFVDERQAKIDAGRSRGQAAQDIAGSDDKILSDKIAESRRRAKEILDSSAKESGRRRAETLQRARAEAGKFKNRSEEELSVRYATDRAALEAHEDELAKLLADSILG